MRSPSRYEKVTDDLLIELFYPTSAQKERRVLESRARKILEQLVDAGEARVVNGKLLPPG